MSDGFDSPPTAEEMKAAGHDFNSPPTPDEMQAAGHDAPPEENYSKADSLWHGLGQGTTLGFGDELGAGAHALLSRYVLPESMGGESAEHNKAHSFSDDYTRERDINRSHDAQAKDAHGGYYAAGQVAGAIPATIAGGELLPVVGGAGYGAAIANGAIQGGVQGLVQGLGTSNAEDIGGALKDTATGGVVGGVTGGLVGGAIHAVPDVLNGASDLADKGAVMFGRRAYTNGANRLSVKNMGLTDDVVREGLDKGDIGYFDSIKDIAKKSGDRTQGIGQEIGAAKGAVDAEVKGVETNNLADMLEAKGDKIALESPNSAVANKYYAVAKHIRKLGDENGELGFAQGDKIKSNAQADARAAYDTLKNQQTPAGRAQEDIAAIIKRENDAAALKNALYPKQPEVVPEAAPAPTPTPAPAAPQGPDTAEAVRQVADELEPSVAPQAVQPVTGRPQIRQGVVPAYANQAEAEASLAKPSIDPFGDTNPRIMPQATALKAPVAPREVSGATPLPESKLPVGDARNAYTKPPQSTLEPTNAAKGQVSPAAPEPTIAEPELSPAADVRSPNQKAMEAIQRLKGLREQYALAKPAARVAEMSAKRAEGQGIGVKDLLFGGGHPVGIGAAYLARTRGASTAAAGLRDVSSGLGKLGEIAVSAPEKLGPYAGVLSRAAQRGGSSLAATNFVLSGSDPVYQAMKKKLDNE